MKITDILGGAHRRRSNRGPRIKRLRQEELMTEGGNVFPDSVNFDHAIIPDLMKQINSVLAKTGSTALPIGSGATPTPGKISGDLDMIVDINQLKQHFRMEDEKDPVIRKKLRQLFDLAGFATGQSGTSVHVAVPFDDNIHQVDIMVVPDANNAATYHTHSIPQGSKFKGVHKQLAMAYLAKQQNMLWSPYQGLFSRLENGKKDPNGLVSNNIDQIAKALLGPNAVGKDLGSLESIMAALGQEAGDNLLSDLRSDGNWKEAE